jgi:aminoglycoside phosphotransferase (APT) family kinase protein
MMAETVSATGLLQPDPARIDAAWMTAALRQAGALRAARVTDMVVTPVGNGLVADCFRFALQYDAAEAGGPASVIGKFPAKDPTSRKSGTDHVLYLREVSFYRDLAATVAIHTPRAYVAEINTETDDFTLILADLTPARQGDQLAGCSLGDAATAMVEAAALHGPRWGDATLATLDWLHKRPATLTPMVDAMLPHVITAFRERYLGAIEPEFMELVVRLPAALVATRADVTTPRTVIHADFRLDNILFDVNGGERPMATLDWQTVTIGAGASDVAYFLSAGIDPAERRLHEAELVRRYHEALLARGVRRYGWDQCWQDYRRYTLHGILMGVFSSMSVERTERGDALFLKMTRGACAQALELGSFGFWEA